MTERILILCTGNSCRSIMAEAFINQLGAGCYKAVSAGSAPTGQIHPQSITTLMRHHINVEQARSKSWTEFAGHTFIKSLLYAIKRPPKPVLSFLVQQHGSIGASQTQQESTAHN